MFFKLKCFLMLLLCVVELSVSLFQQTTWQTAVEIREYKTFSSSSTLYFTVPELTVTSYWLLTASRNPQDKCEVRTVRLFFQPESFPVINPLNETFPPDFNLQRNQLQTYEMSSDFIEKEFVIENPVHGGWFVKVYLGDFIDKSLKQKGLHVDCKYYLGSTHVVEVLEEVNDLSLSEVTRVEAQSHSLSLYRFHTELDTWKYTIVAENCTVNGTDSDLSYCPVRLATRAIAVPNFNDSSNVIDCSDYNATSCVLSVNGPPTNTWQYVIFQSRNADIVQFDLSVTLSSCSGSSQNDTVIDGAIDEYSSISHVTVDSIDTCNLTTSDSCFSEAKHNLTGLVENDNGLLLRNHSDVNERYQFAQNKASLKRSVRDISNTSHMKKLSHSELTVFDSILLRSSEQRRVVSPPGEENENNIDTCIIMDELGRLEIPTRPFEIDFKMRIFSMYPIRGNIIMPELSPLVIHFNVLHNFDIGATLKYQLSLITKYLNNSNQLVTVNSCIQRLGIPMSSQGITCYDSNFITVNNTEKGDTRQMYFPYPEPGHWYITLMAKCYNIESNGSERCAQEVVAASVLVNLRPCVDGGCGVYGTCYYYRSHYHRYSSCQCDANYRGYGCTDDSQAISDSRQLTSILLLTLSNLFFIPAIIVSLYRRFLPEAVSYSYTMFFSTMYHACDASVKYGYCLVSFDVLQFCDFFAAILSIFVTLVALAELLENMRSFFLLLGAVVIVFCVSVDQFSLWAFIVPLLGGLLIMVASWSRICYHRRECYPEKKRWFLLLIPGLVIAGTGLVVYAFFMTEDNYWLTHSTWHACMALCIVFLLPPRTQRAKVVISGLDSIKEDLDVNL